MIQENPDRLLTTRQAAEYLSFDFRTVEGWRHKGGGPRFVKVSARGVRYRRSDLDTWIGERLRTSTSDPGPSEE